MFRATRLLVRFAALVVLSSTLVSRPARSEETNAEAKLDRIEQLVRKADFDRAEREAQELLDTGRVSRAVVVRVHVALGLVAAARGDEAIAERAFVRALRLEPDAALPASAGPHVLDAFARSRKKVSQDARLSVRAELSRGASQVEVRLWIEGPDDGLAHAVVVEGPDFRRQLSVGNRSALNEKVALPPGDCIELTASVADEHGNVLWPELARAKPCGSMLKTSPPPPTAAGNVGPKRANAEDVARRTEARSRPIPVYVWVGAGLTLGLAGATTVFGVKALDARSEYHSGRDDPTKSYESKRALYNEAVDARLAPNVLGIATAAAGATTVFLFFTRPHQRRVALAPRVAAGAVIVDLGAEF